MNSDEFRELINNRYKECMEDCQMPTGALAELNRAEFFAYEMYLENIQLKEDNVYTTELIESIYKATSRYWSR